MRRLLSDLAEFEQKVVVFTDLLIFVVIEHTETIDRRQGPYTSRPGRWRGLSATRSLTFADIHRNRTRASPVQESAPSTESTRLRVSGWCDAAIDGCTSIVVEPYYFERRKDT
jgi:hypothetical protein